MQKPIAHFPTSRPVPTQSLWTATLEVKSCFPPFFLSLPQLWLLTWHGTEYPLCQFGSAALDVPPPSLLPIPGLFKGWGSRVTKQSWCRCTAQQQEKPLGCHQNCFSHKSKTYRLLWRNSTPSQTCYSIILLNLSSENKPAPNELKVFLQTRAFSITNAYSKALVLKSLAIYYVE